MYVPFPDDPHSDKYQTDQAATHGWIWYYLIIRQIYLFVNVASSKEEINMDYKTENHL